MNTSLLVIGNSVQNFADISRNSVISAPPKFENFRNNNLNIFKSIFKNSLKMNFGRNSLISAMSEIFSQTKFKTLIGKALSHLGNKCLALE